MLLQPLTFQACHDVSLTTHATSSRVWQGRARAIEANLCTTTTTPAAAGSAAADAAAGAPEPAGVPDWDMLFLVEFSCGDHW